METIFSVKGTINTYYVEIEKLEQGIEEKCSKIARYFESFFVLGVLKEYLFLWQVKDYQ